MHVHQVCHVCGLVFVTIRPWLSEILKLAMRLAACEWQPCSSWTWGGWSLRHFISGHGIPGPGCSLFSSALHMKEQLIEVRTSSHAGVAHASTNGQDTSAACDMTGESHHLMSDQRMEPWASMWDPPVEVVFFNNAGV